MRSRTLWRASGIVVACGIVAAAAIVTVRPDRAPPVEQARVTRLWAVDMRRIAQVVITRPRTGATTAWSRRGGRWVSSAGGIWQEGSALLLTRPQVQRVADRPGDPARFGLHPPRIIVSIVLADGERRQVLVGDRLPDGRGYYVTPAAGSAAVYAIDRVWVEVLEAAYLM